nr:reverse transcriptase domain-containing protein [Tanacetum cinerariifolium]
MNIASSSGTGSLPNNTVPNPQEDLKAITTRSGVTLAGPSVSPYSSSKEFDECLALADLELTLYVDDEAITFKVGQTSKYSYNDAESINRIDVIDVACLEYVQEVLGFFNNSKSGNPIPTSDPIITISSPFLTLFGGGDFILEEIEACFTSESILPGVDDTDLDLEGDIRLLEEVLNNDPSLSPLPPKELNVEEIKTIKSSIDEPSELQLKELPSHLEYAYLEGTNMLSMIITKDLKDDEKEALLKVLKSHKQAIAWKIFDIKGIDPRFCTHKILIEDDFKPTIQSQRRVNPKIHEVIKKEVIKLLDARMIYPIFDSPWEKCHFMVKEGIVLGYKISKNGLEVDRDKVDVIAKLPHPTTVKGVRSFLGHAGAVLGQRHEKHFRPIHYDSKTMTEAESNYTTTEKEMLAVVYAFEKSRSYLIMNKSIVHTDHSALKYLFAKKDAKARLLRFGAHRAIISDRGTHFCNDQFAKVMRKYGVIRRLSTAYHPQTSGQVEVSNRGLKRILERTIGQNRAFWSDKLDDALWAFRTAYKTPIGCTPYKLVYGKACHLPMAVEHKAFWALKQANFDLTIAGDHRKVQLNELNELRDHAYENSLIYKEIVKRFHDFKIKNRIFNVGDRVLLFNSRLKIFSGKLRTRWSGPFTITKVFPYGTVELSQANGSNFKVNGHRNKHYFRGDVLQLVVPDLQTSPLDQLNILENVKTLAKGFCTQVFISSASYWESTYKTPIGCTPYKLVYGKACHLPIELEHKAYWALKQANFDLTVAGDHRKIQLNELNEFVITPMKIH